MALVAETSYRVRIRATTNPAPGGDVNGLFYEPAKPQRGFAGLLQPDWMRHWTERK